jgi:hypothetical protein
MINMEQTSREVLFDQKHRKNGGGQMNIAVFLGRVFGNLDSLGPCVPNCTCPKGIPVGQHPTSAKQGAKGRQKARRNSTPCGLAVEDCRNRHRTHGINFLGTSRND